MLAIHGADCNDPSFYARPAPLLVADQATHVWAWQHRNELIGKSLLSPLLRPGGPSISQPMFAGSGNRTRACSIFYREPVPCAAWLA
jgi:hypothetical protein